MKRDEVNGGMYGLEQGGLVNWFFSLLKIPSVNPPGRERLMTDFLPTVLTGWGGAVRAQEVRDGRCNLLAEWNFGPGPVLMFNTHLDVNNPEGQKWETDPFSPAERDGRIYARGAADAKGSLAAMTWACRRLAANPEGLHGKIVFAGVMGEESGGEGTLSLVRQGSVHADGAVVGEPTGLEVAVANKGTFIRRIVFKGRSAHSGEAHLGENAVIPAAGFVLAAERANAVLRQKSNRYVGSASLTVTLINGGNLQNTVPDRCSVTFDRRLIPGETHDSAREELQSLLGQEGLSRHVESLEELVASFPCESPAESAVVTASLGAAREAWNPDARLRGFSAGSDMSKLVLLGKIPSVILGPGKLAQAHIPDEFVEMREVEAAVKVYELLARRFLTGK
ncbi:MAG: M20 family metallopeptidase [Firmicutes bacterium]|nr:M20 family metallopeptidase [Bacillota bacterium]